MAEAPLNSPGDAPPLACYGLVRHFREQGRVLEVLRGVDLSIASGERVAVVGASGCGKTTLLQLLGGLDTPTEGRVEIDGRNFSAMRSGERGMERNRSIGFVYQFHHLLPEFNAVENVAMPLLIRRSPTPEAMERAAKLLMQVGLGERLSHRRNCPGESASALRWRARLLRALALFSPTSRPAIWTRIPASRCLSFCCDSTATAAPRWWW